MVRFVNIIFREFFVNEHKNLQFSIIYGKMLGPQMRVQNGPKGRLVAWDFSDFHEVTAL